MRQTGAWQHGASLQGPARERVSQTRVQTNNNAIDQFTPWISTCKSMRVSMPRHGMQRYVKSLHERR